MFDIKIVPKILSSGNIRANILRYSTYNNIFIL